MFTTIKKVLLAGNKKLILTMFLTVSSLVFTVTGCNTWNPNTSVPVVTSTPTTTSSVTPTNTATSTATETPTQTATNTPTTTPTATSAAPCANPAAVDLGTADNYVILAETGITDVPSSAVTGDIGNLGTATQIGLTCAEVTGIIYAFDGTGPLCFTQDTSGINIAVIDKGTAYTVANGQANCVTELGAGTVTGQTLTRGKYFWAGNVNIPTDLHLDALADPNARWIFQIGGTLTMASAVTIYLDNGALPQNVLWTVADFTQIGTTANFSGVIIDASYIAVQTGATVHGRLLSHTQVTLDQNVVTFP